MGAGGGVTDRNAQQETTLSNFAVFFVLIIIEKHFKTQICLSFTDKIEFIKWCIIHFILLNEELQHVSNG